MENKLLGLRRRRKQSQKTVARDLGISRPYLSELEHGKYIPSERLQLKIAQYFNCRAEEIFGSEYSKRRPVGSYRGF